MSGQPRPDLSEGMGPLLGRQAHSTVLRIRQAVRSSRIKFPETISRQAGTGCTSAASRNGATLFKKKNNGQKTPASNMAKKHGNLQTRTLTITFAWSQWAFSFKIKCSAFKEWWSGEEEKVSGWPSHSIPCRSPSFSPNQKAKNELSEVLCFL